MTVLELISTWTEEEREQHADLIAECLDREEMLDRIRGNRGKLVEELARSLDRFACGLTRLTQTVNQKASQLQKHPPYIAKGKASA